MLKKYKPNGEIEFRPVYFNSTTKTDKSEIQSQKSFSRNY